MNVAILETQPLEIRNLFEFVLNSGLNENSKPRDIKSKVEVYYNENLSDLTLEDKMGLKQQVQHFSFYDVNNFSAGTSKNDELFKLMVTLSKFKAELLAFLSETKTKNMSFGKLKRKVSPPVEAYEYVGNNKLDIIPSERSYGLLFE